mgnify:CR=1 FL=1|jgi:hypothetical protein
MMGWRYRVVTGDRGYRSWALKAQVAWRKEYFLRGHRLVGVVLLGYGLLRLMERDPTWRLLVGQFREIWLFRIGVYF